MAINHTGRNGLFRGLSIQSKLPLLVCVLLLSVIITYSWVSYLAVKRTSLKASQVRLLSLTEQLGNMFGQSSQNFLIMSRMAARQDTIKKFLVSGGTELKAEAMTVLQNLHRDSLSVTMQILDARKNLLLQYNRKSAPAFTDHREVVERLDLAPDSAKIDRIFPLNDAMYYSVVAAVTDNKTIIGYLIRRRMLRATGTTVEQFTTLLGTNATLFVGNHDGSYWSDLAKPVENPGIDSSMMNGLFEFSRQGVTLLGASQVIPGSPWRVLVGFPKQTILEGSSRFLKTSIIIGGIIMLFAILAAWLVTRNITRPLKKLTNAATSISQGNYDIEVDIDRRDELGKLAHAFNTMSVQVNSARLDLENKVQERTTQLNASNKELEAFSYSVSHDLRAPLRAISGYAVILKEDYGKKLDDEAHRITDKIINNAQMMGQLIDSLISFSQMGATEIISQTVNMNKLVATCMSELLQNENAGRYNVQIDPLPVAQGDPHLVRQVWMNLLSNAIKYSSKVAEPKIHIGCTGGADMNIYFVKDNGAGFDMHYAQKLFGVFQRLHSQKEFEGTGIGLAFAKRIINKHNGDIWAEAIPGGGATFYFSLPAMKEKSKIEARKSEMEVENGNRKSERESRN